MKNIDCRIAELILRTQNASDGGKHIMCFNGNKKAVRDNLAGYGQKDVLILSTIALIQQGKSNYKFAVTTDKSGTASFIVYFQTMVNGEKVQVSFHSFDSNLKRFVNKSFRIKWDHGNSRESAVYAYNHYCHGTYAD